MDFRWNWSMFINVRKKPENKNLFLLILKGNGFYKPHKKFQEHSNNILRIKSKNKHT